MAFSILIDYDNLEVSVKNKGLLFVVESIVKKFSPSEVLDKNVSIRLYGGWYNYMAHSRTAINLISEIASDFPKAMTLSDNATKVIVNVDLALSLDIAPTKLLFNTYRPRGIPSGLQCHHPHTIGCRDTNCPALTIHNFLHSTSCTHCGTYKIDDFLFKGEQKLVDTMLTADIIYLAQREKKLALVSSDDDFWPGILTAISNGAIIYHIHTKRASTPLYYSSTATINYFQRKM